MNPRGWRVVAVALALSALAGCGGGGNGDVAVTPPVTVTPKQEDQFGANFGTAFRADPNANAATPAEGDIAPLSVTTEPATIG